MWDLELDCPGNPWCDRRPTIETQISPVLARASDSRVPSILNIIVDPASDDDAGRFGGWACEEQSV